MLYITFLLGYTLHLSDINIESLIQLSLYTFYVNSQPIKIKKFTKLELNIRILLFSWFFISELLYHENSKMIDNFHCHQLVSRIAELRRVLCTKLTNKQQRNRAFFHDKEIFVSLSFLFKLKITPTWNSSTIEKDNYSCFYF